MSDCPETATARSSSPFRRGLNDVAEETASSDFAVRFVKSGGPREWVVMLPGAGATISVWAPQVRAFAEHFNLALVDFPGHGRRGSRCTPGQSTTRYSFDALTSQLGATLDAVGVDRCHIVALSLGTILARGWADRNPAQLQSAVLAGTIADLNLVTRTLMNCGWYVRRVLPYMAAYRMYAWIIMPGRSPRRTRMLFYRDAQALGRAEFNRWFDLSSHVGPLLRALRERGTPVPTLHVMGANDRMFLAACKGLAAEEGSSIVVIPGVGHVCSVEAATTFNDVALDFLRRHSATSHNGV
jgi:pimeloyl-ACP methyl ester carboxylesterase